MNIFIFDAEPWEKKLMKPAFKGQKVTFFEEALPKVDPLKYQKAEIISGFITSPVTAKTIQALPKLKMISTRSTGFDHIDLNETKKRGITVSNVPSYGENTVAEHTFALILALSRHVHKSYQRTLRQDFSVEGLRGFDLQGKTIGVVGAGKIGLHVIRIAKGFGMKVLAFDPHPNEFMAETLDFEYVSLNKLLSKSDIVSLHVPYNPKTHHLLNKDNIIKIKKGALIINTARGGLIETEALIKALDSNHLSGAGLDVLEEEQLLFEEQQLVRDKHTTPAELAAITRNHTLVGRDNVVFTPHIAFYSQEAVERITNTTIENIANFIKGKKENVVE